jgi:PAT family beta-lactamase induction signal transducer AmpG
VIVAAPTGYFAEWLGWTVFFTACAVIAIPGLLVLTRFRTWLENGSTDAE